MFKGWKKRTKATALATYEEADIGAIRALYLGNANEAQQQRALSWIINQASGTYEFNYYGDERDTSFALGRAFVGQQIVGLIKSAPNKEN
jgi:hypothetical protein